MRVGTRLLLCALLIVVVASGCTKNKKAKFPDIPPQEVAVRFFRLLADGGRLTLQEAQKMVSTKYGVISEDNFRKWTENFGSTKNTIKVVKSVLPQAPNKKGEWIATVNLEVKTPSMFSDSYTSTSQINFILDEKENEWKVDFMGDTLDEAQFKAAPLDADGTELASGKQP